MRLYGSLTSPFVRKVRVVLAEKQLACTFVRENPRLPGSHAQRLNPLGKVPILELDDGETIFDSTSILEHLASLDGPPLIPSDAKDRRSMRRLETMADGLLESTIRVWLERRRPSGDRRHEFIEWELRRIDRVLQTLASETKRGLYFFGVLSVADLVVAIALEYVDLRRPVEWRAQHSGLAVWLGAVSQRASMVSTALGEVP